jgi:hypothetical protein
MYNSTIRQKTGVCPLCPGTHKVPVVKGFCQRHYWDQLKMKSVAKAQEKALADDVDLQTLVDDLDIIFSRYIRLKYANEHGNVECYTCSTLKHYKAMQCGHFIPRAHMYTRYSEENCKPQCSHCNEGKDGNLKSFAEHLVHDRPGSVDILQEQARIVHHFTREELKAMIGDYSRRVKLLLNNVYQ